MTFRIFVAFLTLIASLQTMAATRIWTGGSLSLSWSAAANWQSNIAPTNYDDLVFPQVTKKTAINDFPNGTTFRSITITAANYVLSGNPLKLDAGLTNSAVSNTVQLPITFTTNNVIYSQDLNGKPFTISGDITLAGMDGTNITFAGGTINVSGNISSPGKMQGIFCSSGVLYLTGSNSFNGDTEIGPQGTILAATSNALGYSLGHVYIYSDTTNRAGCLELTNNVSIPQWLFVSSIITNAQIFSPHILSKSGSNTITGTIEVTNLDDLNPGVANICVSNGNLTISNSILGSGGVAKWGAGQLIYAQSQNPYTGLTFVAEGLLLSTMRSGALPFGGDATVYSSFKSINSFKMNDGHILADYGTVDFSGHSGIVPILNGNGTLALNGGTLVVGTSLGNGRFDGTIAGPGKVSKLGIGGTQILSGINTQTNTGIGEGTLVVNGIQTNGLTTVSSGATLVGTGYCGSVSTSAGGNVGTLTPWGTLHVIGDLTLSNATFSTAITNTNAFGQLDVTGNIILTNATLAFTNTFFPPVGTTFTVIKNHGANPITGIFANTPEGTTLAKLVPFQLSYLGNAANNITLTRTQPPSAFSSVKTTASTIQLFGAGISNATYSFEASTNLIDWTNLSTVTPSTSTFGFTNPISTFSNRFYRIKTL